MSQKQQLRQITQVHLRKIKTAEAEWKDRAKDIADGRAKSMLEKLEERGLVNQVVGNRDELEKVLVERRVGVYCGVDPTAASLHIGHMVPFMALGWMYIHGYASTFLLGGFTSSIGDPTDRLTARPGQKRDERRNNMMNMFEQLKRLSVRIEKYAERRGYSREWAWRRGVLNNNEWWAKVTVKDFMKILGSVTRVGPMLGRDSVKNRLTKGDGMSFAELSYPLIQAWDWWHLYQTGTQIQIGGADQFGNILAGAEAVKGIVATNTAFQMKHEADMQGFATTSDPMGFTVPLLTTSSGEKFGKSAGNAIWIDKQLTSSFDLYQFFLRSADEDIEKYLKMLTFMPMGEIKAVMEEHLQDASKRTAQHRLAFEFVELAHGLADAEAARDQHKQAFSKTLSLQEVKEQMQSEARISSQDRRPPALHPSINKHAAPLDMDSTHNINIKLPRSLVEQQPLPRVLWSAGLVASRSEGQRLINNKGVYIGGRISQDGQPIPMTDQVSYVAVKDSKWSWYAPLIVDDLIVLRVGKWKKKFIQIVSDEEYEASGETCPGWKDETETAADPQVMADLAGEETHRKLGKQNAATKEQRRRDQASLRSGGFGVVLDAQMRKD
ncbi:tyrosyl-tRNA synthetase [Lithohypha guttulata]|uniref:tyrosyl-tRNA synthetase n=1 Tax=Lithohypha guttulata TaxID=1690604 RepID=UPI002DDE7CCB|nr:tyrosyl-tRNA synthetase [Lithohypha guttulata]KAK5097524.1 tyrosyl-tRNA synthetase [Lithohypha guttulata]